VVEFDDDDRRVGTDYTELRAYRPTWEYTVKYYTAPTVTSNDPLTGLLNEFGAEGWELVGMPECVEVQRWTRLYVAIFKRIKVV